MRLLDQMPPMSSALDVCDWLDTLDDADFDRVCCEAFSSAHVLDDGAAISTIVLVVVLKYMRDRYRDMLRERRVADDRAAAGHGYSNTKLIEMQVRIIRRMPHAINDGEIAVALGIDRQAVRRARRGLTWKHLPMSLPIDRQRRGKQVYRPNPNGGERRGSRMKNLRELLK